MMSFLGRLKQSKELKFYRERFSSMVFEIKRNFTIIREMKDKYEQVIQLVYELTKEHSEKEFNDKFEAYDILDDVLNYVYERVLEKI
jgi:hypothetical protein